MYAAVGVMLALVTLCTAAAVSDEPIRRLPSTVWPVQYNLTVRTDPLGVTFTGHVSIDVAVQEATDTITLHALRLVLGPVRLLAVSPDSQILEEIEADLNQDQELITVKTSVNLEAGANYRLSLPFGGNLTHGGERGYYRVSTGPTAADWMSGTAFEMNHARKAFPCFDEPQYKARFRVSMVHHVNHTALSNMPLLSTVNNEEEGWVTDHFDNSPVMSSYLAAYHLVQWSFRQTHTDDGKPVRVWATEKQLRLADLTLEFAPQALSWLQQYTGLPDPMPKLDLVTVPIFHGALENWGVISFKTEALIIDTSMSIAWTKEPVRLMAHELSHSWFGDLVTPRWWDSVWLSEGAATFFAALIVDQLKPEWKYMEEQSKLNFLRMYTSNVESSDWTLGRPVEFNEDLKRIPRTAYFKGFSMFRMLYYLLGPEHFQAGIRHYLSELQYKTTTPRLLYEALNYTYEGKDLSELMDAWTYQQGLPVVYVTRSDGHVSLRQERLKNKIKEGADSRKKEEKEKWWIPISYTSGAERRFTDARPTGWFREDLVISDPAEPEDWLLFNLEAAGTYHVMYDDQNLDLLVTALRAGSMKDIPPINIAKLIIDYGVFGIVGLKPKEKVIELLEYIQVASEQHYASWTDGFNLLRWIKEELRDTSSGYNLKKFAQRLMDPDMLRLGMRNRKGDSVGTMRQPKQVVEHACLYGQPDCGMRAGDLFQKLMSHKQPDKYNPSKNKRQNRAMLRDLASHIETPSQLEQLTQMMSMSKMLSDKEKLKMQQLAENNIAWREQNKDVL